MSSKNHKVTNPFKDVREAQHLSREKASELTTYMSPSMIEHIERGDTFPRPEDVLCLSKCYGCPELINLYCCEMCAIGKEVAPKAIHSTPPEIIIHLLSASARLAIIRTDLIHSTSDHLTSNQSTELFSTLHEILNEISSCNVSLSIWLNKQKLK